MSAAIQGSVLQLSKVPESVSKILVSASTAFERRETVYLLFITFIVVGFFYQGNVYE